MLRNLRKEIKDFKIVLNELVDMYAKVVELWAISGYELSELLQLFREGYKLDKSQATEVKDEVMLRDMMSRLKDKTGFSLNDLVNMLDVGYRLMLVPSSEGSFECYEKCLPEEEIEDAPER